MSIGEASHDQTAAELRENTHSAALGVLGKAFPFESAEDISAEPIHISADKLMSRGAHSISIHPDGQYTYIPTLENPNFVRDIDIPSPRVVSDPWSTTREVGPPRKPRYGFVVGAALVVATIVVRPKKR
jgi:hypothetical protein